MNEYSLLSKLNHLCHIVFAIQFIFEASTEIKKLPKRSELMPLLHLSNMLTIYHAKWVTLNHPGTTKNALVADFVADSSLHDCFDHTVSRGFWGGQIVAKGCLLCSDSGVSMGSKPHHCQTHHCQWFLWVDISISFCERLLYFFPENMLYFYQFQATLLPNTPLSKGFLSLTHHVVKGCFHSFQTLC